MEEDREERRPKKGGRILRLELYDTRELMDSPMTISCFKHVGCFDFCELVQRVQQPPSLTRVFISNIQGNQVTIAGVKFTISRAIIVAATRMPNVGEKLFKAINIYARHYESFLEPRYKNENKKVFPLSHLLDRFYPMKKIIMKNFTCEGRFSRLYSYHIRFLMHFTRLKLLNIPHYFYKRIDKMGYKVQSREPEH